MSGISRLESEHMAKTKTRFMIAAGALLVLALLVIIATAFATSGDYGIATGTSSTCGGSSGPSCTINYKGHPASYDSTNSDGSVQYNFDDYDCSAVVATDGTITIGGGSECASVQSTATPAPTETPEA